MAAPAGRSRDPRRYGTTSIRIRDPKVCYFCGSSPLAADVVYCPSCGFPQRGSETEQKRFVVNHKKMGKEVNETHAETGIARIILFILGGLNLIVGIVYFVKENLAGAIAEFIVGLLYVILALWAMKKPVPALISGLVLYLTFIVLDAVADPSSIFSGLVLKAGIIGGLIYGITAVKRAEELKKRMTVQKMDLTEEPSNDPEVK